MWRSRLDARKRYATRGRTSTPVSRWDSHSNLSWLRPNRGERKLKKRHSIHECRVGQPKFRKSLRGRRSHQVSLLCCLEIQAHRSKPKRKHAQPMMPRESTSVFVVKNLMRLNCSPKN